jgi:hypothetical protein
MGGIASVLYGMVFRQALSGATYCAIAPLFQKPCRRPNRFGLLRASWKTLSPSAGRLSFAALAAGYILIGIYSDKHYLIALFGDQYSRHRQHVSLFSPPAEAQAVGGKFAARQADARTIRRPALED